MSAKLVGGVEVKASDGAAVAGGRRAGDPLGDPRGVPLGVLAVGVLVAGVLATRWATCWATCRRREAPAEKRPPSIIISWVITGEAVTGTLVEVGAGAGGG